MVGEVLVELAEFQGLRLELANALRQKHPSQSGNNWLVPQADTGCFLATDYRSDLKLVPGSNPRCLRLSRQRSGRRRRRCRTFRQIAPDERKNRRGTRSFASVQPAAPTLLISSRGARRTARLLPQAISHAKVAGEATEKGYLWS